MKEKIGIKILIISLINIILICSLQAQTLTWTETVTDSFLTGLGVDTVNVTVSDTVGSDGGIVLGPARENIALNKVVTDDDVHNQTNKNLTDGNLSTLWNTVNTNNINVSLIVDLASSRIVGRVIIRTFFQPGFFFGPVDFKIYVSPDNVNYNLVAEITNNTEINPEVLFEPQEARYVKIELLKTSPGREILITEIEIYGMGFNSKGHFKSKIKTFPTLINFGRISWDASVPDETNLNVQCRSDSTNKRVDFEVVSNDTISLIDQPIIAGSLLLVKLPGLTPLTEGIDYYINYEKGTFVRNPGSSIANNDFVRATFLIWSDWTDRLSDSPSELKIPEPRQYFQYRLNFSSENSRKTPEVYSVNLTYLDKLVSKKSFMKMLPDTVQILKNISLTCRIELEFDAADYGIDLVEINTPGLAKNLNVFIDSVQVTNFTNLTILNKIAFQFNQTLKKSGNVLLEARFNITLFEPEHRFPSTIYSLATSEVAEFGQNVEQLGKGFTVITSGVPETTIENLKIGPNPFSPNGDKVFDKIKFSFFITKLSIPRSLTIKIFDLEGNLIKDILSGNYIASPIEVTWDGLKDNGEKVRPGIYLAQINLKTDYEDKIINKLITVVY